MQGRSLRGERPSMASSARSGPQARSAMRPPASRASSLRHPAIHHAVTASRIDRTAAPSPADSLVSSTSTTAGTKRKEREFDIGNIPETNINVVVRCRGRNEREVKENSAVVLSTDAVKGKAVGLSMGPNALSNKSYNFDRVFSQAADQAMVYDDVVRPILEEMLDGFNCTIFAYGQTGTGKTYTMSGDMTNTLGILSDNAGIIPRVLQSLFNKLEVDDADRIVKCSFIELYNEELRDLIAVEESTKLKIYDDTSRKGQTTTVVQGMEESHIKNAADGIKLLQAGSLKRQVAATKCNDLSSRSHTVFTITAHIKRTGEDGEDYVSSGKLNLVDLAGSENIQRSGAENKRAAEAGLINKSLLTLGRVINALVDRSSHIPYRESKLTRLLQDSLGGHTKTCIIATVSPAKSNLEETISTLDYAFRAKNIRNKPQINQMINKKTLLREFAHEIQRLKSELVATRQRNGVYLSNESYEEMTVESESRRIQNEEQAARIEMLESNLRNKVQELFSLTSNFMGLKKDHDSTKAQLDETKGVLDQTELVLKATRKTLAEESHLREAHQRTEEQMHAIGGELISTLQRTVGHVGGLHAKNKRKSDVQSLNRTNWSVAQDQVTDVTSLVEDRVEEFRNEQQTHILSISQRMNLFVQGELGKLTKMQSFLDQDLERFAQSKRELTGRTQQSKEEMDEVLEEIKEVRDNIKERVGDSLQTIATAAETIAQDVLSELTVFHSQLHTSYASLGQGFKSIFEALLKHITAQREESDHLRNQLQGASETIIQSNASISLRIQEVINEERKQAAIERRALLAQITSLVTSQAELQETRLADKAASIRQSVQENGTTLEGSIAQYSRGIDNWKERQDELLVDVGNSRETLKNQLKDDWDIANQHSASIQDTTRSVHAETVRVVDEQMRDLDEQMVSLDDFVTRARSQNGQHHDEHVRSLDRLSDTVSTSYANIRDHFKTTCSRVQDLDSGIGVDVKEIQGTLRPLSESVCQPLVHLREDIRGTNLQEYQPTGDTPQKMIYDYPTEFPRTQTHESLIAKLNGQPSPSKAAVFADADPSLAMNRSPTRPYSSESMFPLPDRERNPMGMSLREVHPNINNTSTSSCDPRSSATTHGVGASATSESLVCSDAVTGEDVTLPLLKKSRTTRPKSGKKMSNAEGRENMPLFPGMGKEVLSQSISRRKSPRLN
ncbi:kinesin-domain-containing protein [Xylariaceae sp. FL0016]|nr:kinesin-domain-containing protein [Xylariaceae sp. FL0016]